MFKKSRKTTEVNMFSNVEQHLRGAQQLEFQDSSAWYNVFYKNFTSQIDETIFSPLYCLDNGRTNSSIRLLVSMITMKHGHDWTDAQLFESANFNLVVRRALGLTNLDDAVPSPSTYYFFRKSLYEYEQKTGVNLFDLCFEQVTGQQVLDFEVNGKMVRMDSKLFNSNISKLTLLQLFLGVLLKFYNSLLKIDKAELLDKDKELFNNLVTKSAINYTFHLNKAQATEKLDYCFDLTKRLLQKFEESYSDTESYNLLLRLYNEQKSADALSLRKYDGDNNGVGKNLQSPHDNTAGYRTKKNAQGKDTNVRGYVTNLTETCSIPEPKDAVKDDENEVKQEIKVKPLELITAVETKNVAEPDTEFFQSAIAAHEKVAKQEVETSLTDGAYNSTLNVEFAEKKNIKWYLTAIQGFKGNFSFEKIDGEDCYNVTDLTTGKIYKSTGSSKKGAYRITLENGKNRYFKIEQITNSFRRAEIKNHPDYVQGLRANTPSTLHQVFCKLNGNKRRYRGLHKNHLYALTRSLWANITRIRVFVEAKNAIEALICLIFQFLTLTAAIDSASTKKNYS